MGYLENTQLYDLDDSVRLECECPQCNHLWVAKPSALMKKAPHKYVYLDELAAHLNCHHPYCPHQGLKLTLISAHDTSGFVGGMP